MPRGLSYLRSRRRRRWKRRVIFISPALLLLLIVVGGIAFTGSGNDGADDRASGGTTSEETSATNSTTTRETIEDTNKEATTSSQEETTASTKDEGGEPPNILVEGGAEDNTNGPLTDHRMVSYYGHPLSGAMGVLGQYEDPEEMFADLEEQANAYTELTPQRPAIPTIELIASVAQASPGEDGLYVRRTSDEQIEKYARLAEEKDGLLLLDIQPGQSSIAEEVEEIRPYLKRPYVHLAIDCEWNMAPGEVPAQTVGQCSTSEIMDASKTLSEVVEKNDLPPKVLVVHQFQADMIVNKEALEPTENVEMVIHADGFGLRKNKLSKYKLLVKNQPVQYGGFKLFYNQDVNLFSPRETLEKLDPDPAVVSYQ